MRTHPPPITINNRQIGAGQPVYIIAEMSANHGHSYDEAVRIIHAAKEAGADAIKLQTYTPDTVTINCRSEYFRIEKTTLWRGRNLYDLYGEAFTPWEWQPKLKAIANDLDLDWFSTPSDETSLDFLESLEVPVHKVASFEIVDLPLLRKIAHTMKPIILSTGMATLAEIEEAVQIIRGEGNNHICLLKCTSAYPASPQEMNLCTIPHLAEAFHAPVGLSDHSLDLAIPISAVTLGASVIEKHFTLSRNVEGPDSAFSLEPQEFKAMVAAVRTAEAALGRVRYGPSPSENDCVILRRSLFVVQDMQEGELFTHDNIRSIRPGHGLHSRYLDELIGKRAAHNIMRGTPMQWSFVKNENRGN